MSSGEAAGTGSTPTPGEPVSHGNGKSLIVVTDPHGYCITLDVDTWETHIVDKHPEVKGYLDVLKKTIEEPELIRQPSYNKSIFFYYRMTGMRRFRCDDLYLSAVIQRNESNKTGFVKTAYLVKELKGGETVWFQRT